MSQSETHGKPADPYRVFFPLGALMGIAGVSIWPLYYWGWIGWYNGRSHAFVQTNCFLYSFVVGFLWTAIPRFTGTSAPPRPLQYVVVALILAQAFAFELRAFPSGHVLFVFCHAIVLAFAARCFMRRRHPPPETFALVGIGLLSGLLAAVVNAGIALEWVPSSLDLMGKRMMTEGMMLLLVIGVGGFLGPRLLGFAQIPDLQNIGTLAGKVAPARVMGVMAWRRPLYAAVGLAIALCVIVEYVWNVPFLAWIRAAVITTFVLLNTRLYRSPLTRSTLAWCVWLGHWFLLVALWLIVAAPRYRSDLLHVMFMGAFTLLILAVGTRVVLSHGGHSLAEERRSWPLRIGLATGLIAMLSRVGVVYASAGSYFSHLAWAALFWIAGILIWGTYLGLRIRSRQ